MMFPERIKYLRQTQGLNQVQLADKLGTTKQSISNWENDNIVPSVDMLEKIADFFCKALDKSHVRVYNQIKQMNRCSNERPKRRHRPWKTTHRTVNSCAYMQTQ